VRRLLAFGSAAVAAFGLVRRLTTRRRAEPPLDEPPADPRAQELRRRLDESRAVVGEREEFESGETTVDAAEPAPDPDARRRRVHDEARAVVDEMRDTPPE
jgi:hypothetical protein